MSRCVASRSFCKEDKMTDLGAGKGNKEEDRRSISRVPYSHVSMRPRRVEKRKMILTMSIFWKPSAIILEALLAENLQHRHGAVPFPPVDAQSSPRKGPSPSFETGTGIARIQLPAEMSKILNRVSAAALKKKKKIRKERTEREGCF